MTMIRLAEPQGHFRVTYSSITEESAQCGDIADHGYLDWRGYPVDDYADSQWDLRDLIDRLSGCYVEGDGADVPSFISVDPESDFWLSSFWTDIAGDDAIGVTAYVHRPSWITDSSWVRVARVLGWRHR